MNTKTRTLTIAGIVVLALGAGFTVAACTQTDEPTTPVVAATTPAPIATQPTEAPAPVETPEACTVPAVGATVMTMGEITCAEDAGLIAYRLDEGAVILDPAAPEVPVEVATKIVAPLVASTAGKSSVDVSGASAAASEDAAKQLGRPVVIIVSMETANGTRFGAMASKAEVRSDLGRASVAITAADAMAKAREWVATQPDSVDWVILDATL